MNKTEIAVAVLLVIMVAAVMYVQRPPGEPESPALPQEPAVSSVPAATAEPEIRYPVEAETPAPPAAEPAGEPDDRDATPADAAAQGDNPERTAAPADEPLPALDESDAALTAELQPVFGNAGFSGLFYPDRLIRRLVVTVDNLPNRQYPRSNYRVARSVPGQLLVRRVRVSTGDEETLYLNPDNYARYTPFVTLATSMNSQRLVMVYRHFYPLFQAAYADLGYPSAYFNDRLVDVIDHLLETPDVGGDIKLVRPHVLYKYADPQLEALSAGQKVLIRVGPENAAALKSKLRELRQLLTGTPAAAPPEDAENPPLETGKTPKV